MLLLEQDRKITAQLVTRALAAGYTALAVTVDTPVLGRREADMRNRFKLPDHLTMGNFTSAGGAHAEGTKDGGNDSVSERCRLDSVDGHHVRGLWRRTRIIGDRAANGGHRPRSADD